MIQTRLLTLVSVTLLFSGSTRGAAQGAGQGATTVPRYDGLGGFSRKVTTASPEAHCFDQGLSFLYAFNHLKLPGNGWSLYGLARSLRLQKRVVEAGVNEKQFAKSWAKADMKIRSPCLCLPGV